MTTIINRSHIPEASSILTSPPPPKLDRKFYRNGEIFYPDSDGEPAANSTKHLEYIDATKYGLEQYFQANEDVFVSADLLWYPVQGYPNICSAPDVMLAFGRPKGSRRSYKQWEESDIAPQVVFEFLSLSNTQKEMMRKFIFFQH
jgi:Uma2 family endonuclease